MRTIRTFLWVNGVAWDVTSGTITEDMWQCPAITAALVCPLPDDWQERFTDARRVLPALLQVVLYEGGAEVDSQMWRLMVRRSEVSIVDGTIRWDLASMDLMWRRDLSYTISIGGGTIANAVVNLIEYLGDPPSSSYPLITRLGVYVLDETGGAMVPSGADGLYAAGGDGIGYIERVTLGAGVRVTARRDGSWRVLTRDTLPQEPTVVLRTAQVSAEDFDAAFAGWTVADFDAAFAGWTVAELEAHLRATIQPTGGTITDATITTDIDEWGNVALGINVDGYPVEAIYKPDVLGRWTVDVPLNGEVSDPFADSALASTVLARYRQAGRGVDVDAVTDTLAVEPGDWAAVLARSYASGPQQVQRVEFDLAACRTSLRLRPIDPGE